MLEAFEKSFNKVRENQLQHFDNLESEVPKEEIQYIMYFNNRIWPTSLNFQLSIKFQKIIKSYSLSN